MVRDGPGDILMTPKKMTKNEKISNKNVMIIFWHARFCKFARNPDLFVVTSGFYGSESCPGVSREVCTPSGDRFSGMRPGSVKDF